MRWGLTSFAVYRLRCPSWAAGAGILESDAPAPPFTVGQPSTQSTGSSSAGRLVKPVANSKNGSCWSTAW